MRISVLFFFTLCLMYSKAYSQKTEYESTTISYNISSASNNEYKLNITFPSNYDSSKSYKVLYYFDAYALSGIVQGTYSILHLLDKVENVVLIGISIDGNQLDWNKQRVMDFTPTIFDLEKKRGKIKNSTLVFKSGMPSEDVELNQNTTGGANLFVDFLNSKVFKYIENKYPNLEKRRGFLGHSYAGLLGIYLVQNNPDLFQDMIIISASVSWNDNELLNLNLFSKFKESKKEYKIYHCYGGIEFGATTKSNDELHKLILELEKENFDYNFKIYSEADHHSILPSSIYDGLLYLYRK